MKRGVVHGDLMLLGAALIWGIGFVPQRTAMDHLPPMAFNAGRFGLGALVLLIAYRWIAPGTGIHRDSPVRWGLAAGLCLFLGATCQQIGIITTTAGKAGFITGLYVVLVPLLGMALRIRPTWFHWLGAGLAVIGLYLLSVEGSWALATGDLWVLVGAVFWAAHIHVVGKASTATNPVLFTAIQCAVCAGLSLVSSLVFESVKWAGVVGAGGALLYGGLLSTGLAFALQVGGQAKAAASHSAILLSLEAVFAAAAGWMLLGETLTVRALSGCAILLLAMVLSQWGALRTAHGAGPT